MGWFTSVGRLTTVSVQSPDSPGTSVLALPEGDGRYVRSLAWGSEKVGLVFALRAASSNFSLPNDLYYLPRFGQSMQLLATAGIAAPAAVVDEVAVAQNGTTVAFTVLIPGQVGLRFHSVWVTDALSPAPVQADTSGLRRVTVLEWTTDGLAVSGTRRTQEDGAAYQIAVVERLGAEKSKQVSADRSAAAPTHADRLSSRQPGSRHADRIRSMRLLSVLDDFPVKYADDGPEHHLVWAFRPGWALIWGAGSGQEPRPAWPRRGRGR